MASFPKIEHNFSGANAQPVEQGSSNMRARLSAFPGASEYVYGPRGQGNIMDILHETRGMIFPYTPSINHQTNVSYDQYAPVHSNQGFATYKNTDTAQITVSGIFTVQNDREREYALAVIHFCRTVSKMRFGESDPLRGNPPPMLHFSAYGSLFYNRIQVVMQNFQLDFDNTVDLVYYQRRQSGAQDVNSQNSSLATLGDAYIPARFSLTVGLLVQHTPRQMRKEFSWERFRNGDLLTQGSWL